MKCSYEKETEVGAKAAEASNICLQKTQGTGNMLNNVMGMQPSPKGGRKHSTDDSVSLTKYQKKAG